MTMTVVVPSASYCFLITLDTRSPNLEDHLHGTGRRFGQIFQKILPVAKKKNCPDLWCEHYTYISSTASSADYLQKRFLLLPDLNLAHHR